MKTNEQKSIARKHADAAVKAYVNDVVTGCTPGISLADLVETSINDAIEEVLLSIHKEWLDNRWKK